MPLFVPMWMTKVLLTPDATLSIAVESQEKLKIG